MRPLKASVPLLGVHEHLRTQTLSCEVCQTAAAFLPARRRRHLNFLLIKCRLWLLCERNWWRIGPIAHTSMRALPLTSVISGSNPELTDSFSSASADVIKEYYWGENIHASTFWKNFYINILYKTSPKHPGLWVKEYLLNVPKWRSVQSQKK